MGLAEGTVVERERRKKGGAPEMHRPVDRCSGQSTADEEAQPQLQSEISCRTQLAQLYPSRPQRALLLLLDSLDAGARWSAGGPNLRVLQQEVTTNGYQRGMRTATY